MGDGILTELAALAARRAWTMELAHLRAYVRLTKGMQLERSELRILAEEKAAAAARPPSGRQVEGAIAVIPLLGAMTQRGGMSSAGTDAFGQAVKSSAGDTNIRAMVLEIDSPGGEVYGVENAATEVARAAKIKPVIVSVNSLTASAAYYVASQASEIMVTPGGELGSIGVYAAHEDWSRAMDEAGVIVTLVSAGEGKTDGHPFAPLSEEALADMTSTVNRCYGEFVAAVSKGRRVSEAKVRDKWKARVYGAQDAVEIGMADSIGTLSDAIRRAGQLSRSRSAVAAALDVEVETRMRARNR